MAGVELPGAGALTAWRADKDRYLRDDPRSPLYGEGGFAGLAYYPEDGAWRVEASVERPTEPDQAILGTSSGEERLYLVYGVARFAVGGVPQSLTLFATPEAPDGPRLFVPFRDATAGTETYGAGRYLEVEAGADAGRVTLDFNYAYHPYCAYAEGYSCPFPPPQNALSVPVRAGERLADADAPGGRAAAPAGPAGGPLP